MTDQQTPKPNDSGWPVPPAVQWPGGTMPPRDDMIPPAPPASHEPWPEVPEGSRPRKRRRVFMWSFLAVQALFVLWVVVGLATVHTGPSLAEVHQGCDNGAWQGLFKSHADCMTHYASGLNQAGEAGKGIGLALVIGLWVAVDVILGIGRLIVVTARSRGTRGA